MAVSSLLFFKRLSELFLRVAKSTSITQDIIQVFPTSQDLQDLMCEYLITLVQFCGKITKVAGRPPILQLASPFLGFFDKEASQFEKELTQWSNCIDRKAVVLLSQRHVDAADTITKIGRALAQWVPSDKKKHDSLILRSRRLQDQLCSQQSERAKAWRRQRRKGNTKWIFQEASYQEWKHSSESSILLIHRKLGSSKTVLLANIVADLHSFPIKSADRGGTPSHLTAYFFYNRDPLGSNTTERIIRSIMQQVIAQLDPDSPGLSELEAQFLRYSPSFLDAHAVENLRLILPTGTPLYIVLDALGECDRAIEEVLVYLESIASTHMLRLCYSTRTAGLMSNLNSSALTASPFLMARYEISITSPAIVADMKDLVEAEFERNRHIRNLEGSLEEILKEVLVGASEGMYAISSSAAMNLNVRKRVANT